MPCINHTQTMGESAPPQRRCSLVQHLSYYCPALLASRHRDESCSALFVIVGRGTERKTIIRPSSTMDIGGTYSEGRKKKSWERPLLFYPSASLNLSPGSLGHARWKGELERKILMGKSPHWNAQRETLSPPSPFPLIYCSLVIRIVIFFRFSYLFLFLNFI